MRQIFENGTILCMEEEQLLAEAVVIEGGIICGVGTCEEVHRQYPEGERIDLQGRTMLPGFIDPHSHFSSYANSLLQVSLDEAEDWDEICTRIQTFIKENQILAGEWVAAKGYDHNRLAERAHPSREVLDQAAPENPVVIQHKSGHVGVYNTRALEVLGVKEDTPSPSGGKIEVKDKKVTGYMEENAFLQYLQEIPMPSMEAFLGAYETAQKVYASHGITTMQEGMMVERMIPMYQALFQAGILKLDLVGYGDSSAYEALQKAFPDSEGRYDNHFKIGGYKIFLDGSPQGRTAWMRKPYYGETDYCGYNTLTEEQVYEAVVKAAREGRQILAHCNGDAACEQYLCACEKAKAAGYPIGAVRPVMIHAQLLGLDQLKRVKEIPMIPSFFIAHVYHWGDVHIGNFGKERAQDISPAGSALKEGIRFTFHQDAPVIEPDMLETIWCAVNRKTKAGVVLGEEQCIPVLEAFKAVTINGAYQYFEEDRKGSICVGKCADFVVLDQNPLEMKKEELRDIQVMATYKNGVCIYEKMED